MYPELASLTLTISYSVHLTAMKTPTIELRPEQPVSQPYLPLWHLYIHPLLYLSVPTFKQRSLNQEQSHTVVLAIGSPATAEEILLSALLKLTFRYTCTCICWCDVFIVYLCVGICMSMSICAGVGVCSDQCWYCLLK